MKGGKAAAANKDHAGAKGKEMKGDKAAAANKDHEGDK